LRSAFFLRRERDVARELHGDRAGATLRLAPLTRNSRNSSEREHIDATVLIEALILGVQQRFDEQGRHP